MIPLAVPDLRGREKEYLSRCVDDNWVSSAGPYVTELERRMAELSGRSHAIAAVNGTMALQLALVGLNVAAGELVVVPDWTFAATANAVRHAGATPYFVDVDTDGCALDPDLLSRALQRAPAKVGAVIAVDVLGRLADYAALTPICAAAGVPLLEDAAGAIGATHASKPAGGFGAAACFSFNGNKTVTAGGGGMIVTDDAAMASHVRSLSAQARVGQAYEHHAIGFNARMTNLNAAVGLAQLERLDEMVAAKRRIAERYDRALLGRADIVPMSRSGASGSSCWLYSVKVANEDRARSLVAHLAARDIEARVFWRSLCAQAPYRDFPRLLSGVSARLSGSVVSLPCSSHLSDDEQTVVIAALGEWAAETPSRTMSA